MTQYDAFAGSDVPTDIDELLDHLSHLVDQDHDAEYLQRAQRLLERISYIQHSAEPTGAIWKNSPPPPPRRWIIKDWIPAGRLSMMWGIAGGGKSRIALQVAAAVASGGGPHGQWIESPIHTPLGTDQPSPVMYLSWEEDHDEAFRRLAEIAGSTSKDAPSPAPWVTPDTTTNLVFFDLAERGPLWSPTRGRHTSTLAEITAVGHHIRHIAERTGTKLIIVDPLAAAYVANENDRGLVRSFCASWDGWARRTDCAVLLIAHPNKDGAQSGSTDWRGACRSVIELSPSKQAGAKATWRFECVKSNYALPPPPLRLEISTENGIRWTVADTYSHDDDATDTDSTSRRPTFTFDDEDFT